VLLQVVTGQRSVDGFEAGGQASGALGFSVPGLLGFLFGPQASVGEGSRHVRTGGELVEYAGAVCHELVQSQLRGSRRRRMLCGLRRASSVNA
jgi:hypothetical protein